MLQWARSLRLSEIDGGRKWVWGSSIRIMPLDSSMSRQYHYPSLKSNLLQQWEPLLHPKNRHIPSPDREGCLFKIGPHSLKSQSLFGFGFTIYRLTSMTKHGITRLNGKHRLGDIGHTKWNSSQADHLIHNQRILLAWPTQMPGQTWTSVHEGINIKQDLKKIYLVQASWSYIPAVLS